CIATEGGNFCPGGSGNPQTSDYLRAGGIFVAAFAATVGIGIAAGTEAVFAVFGLGAEEGAADAAAVNAGAAVGECTAAQGVNLAAHEAAGGHLIAKHVGKTLADLAARLSAQPGIPAASTFASIAEAEAGVSAVLGARAAQLLAWVSAGAQGRLV